MALLKNNNRMCRCLIGTTVSAAWLLLWQLACQAVGQELLLPSPLSVFRRTAELIATVPFWVTVAVSLWHILCGFLSAVLAGTLLAILTARFSLLYAFFVLPMNLIKATPVASFVILALIWINGHKLSSFISFLMVMPLIWRNVHEGIVTTDVQLLEMARVYHLSHCTTLRAVFFPSVLPHFLAAVRVGAGFAWKAGVAGEVIAIPRIAIGTQLYHAKVYLETTDLFAWTLVIIILSLLLEKISVGSITWLSRRLNGGTMT